MKKLFENWRSFLKEGTPYGGYNPGYAGTLDFGQGTSFMSHKPDKKDPPDDVDTKFVVKAVVHRSGEVVLLLNDQGWDLPGGHKKRNESDKEALKREVEEETGLEIDLSTMTKIKQKGRKTYYQVEYMNDAFMRPSDEHKEIKTYTLEQVEDLDNIDSLFKNLVLKVLSGDIDDQDIIS